MTEGYPRPKPRDSLMAATSSPGNLDLEEQIARIRRAQVETDKFAAEQRKLSAEAAKLDRDRSLAPWQIVATSMAAGAALFGAGIAFVKIFLP